MIGKLDAVGSIHEEQIVGTLADADAPVRLASRALAAWIEAGGVSLDLTRPRQPTDNGHHFSLIDHAKELIDAWRVEYNEQRPDGSLGHLTPAEFNV